MRYDEKSPRDQLIHWVLLAILRGEVVSASHENSKRGTWLDGLFKVNGGLIGDPMWELCHVPEAGGLGHFQAHADEEFSGILPEDDIYPAEQVIEVLVEVLSNEAIRYPENSAIVAQIISRIPEYREHLRS